MNQETPTTQEKTEELKKRISILNIEPDVYVEVIKIIKEVLK